MRRSPFSGVDGTEPWWLWLVAFGFYGGLTAWTFVRITYRPASYIPAGLIIGLFWVKGITAFVRWLAKRAELDRKARLPEATVERDLPRR
jgi:hypothetical protein